MQQLEKLNQSINSLINSSHSSDEDRNSPGIQESGAMGNGDALF